MSEYLTLGAGAEVQFSGGLLPVDVWNVLGLASAQPSIGWQRPRALFKPVHSVVYELKQEMQPFFLKNSLFIIIQNLKEFTAL